MIDAPLRAADPYPRVLRKPPVYMLNGLLLTLNILVCLALIAVVLLQRSEGGALGGGGNPTGLITTRGAGDLLTRMTWILFSTFLVLSLALTLLGGRERSSQAILNRLKLQSVNPNALPATGAAARAAATAPANTAPPPTVQLPATAPHAAAPTPGSLSAPVPSVTLAPLPTRPGKAPAP